MKKNTLYTVNKWNKPLFMPDERNYDIGGFLKGAQDKLTGLFGGNKVAKSPIGGMLGGLGSAVGQIGGSLISGGLSSGAGSAIGNIGGTVGSLVSNVNPVAGAIISAGSGIIGGGINALFGTGVNEEALNAAKEGTAAYNNMSFNAANFDDLGSITAQANVQDAYSGGLFRKGDARRQNEELRRQREEARSFAFRGLGNNVANINQSMLGDALANYAACGGKLHKYDAGGLKAAFMDTFGSDPIGAVIRYNQGLEAQEAKREAAAMEAAQAEEYAAMQQRMADLETRNRGLESLMAANPTVVPTMPRVSNPMLSDISIDYTPSQAAPAEGPDDYGNLKNFIRNHEGFRSKAYWLPGEAAPTIGYGFHAVYPGTNRRVKMGDTISREEAERGLDIVLQNIDNDLSKKVPNWNKMTNYQRDALRDLAYGTGTGGKHFRKNSRLMRALGNEDWEAAERELVSRSASLPEYNKNLLRISKMRQNMFREGKYAFGGELGTNGTDFTNGLLEINAGGTHESNPLEGVPLGLDAEGIPNLVEEGETVYNNYVFSDRMKVPAFMYKELGLGGAIKNKDISFADASKKLAEESKMRPNDTISIDGLQASLSRLAEVQEAERAKQNMREYVGLAALGGKLFVGGGDKWNPYAYDKDITKFKYWNKDKNDYDEGYKNFINNLNQDWIDKVMAGNYGDMSRYRAKNNAAPSIADARTLGLDKKYSDWHKAMAAAYDEYLGSNTPAAPAAPIPATPTGNIYHAVEGDEDYLPGDPSTWNGVGAETRRVALPNGDTVIYHDRSGTAPAFTEEQLDAAVNGETDPNIPKYPTWMRYAPVIGSSIMTLTDALGLTNKPDYTYADKLEAAAEKAGYAPNVTFNPIGDYMRYRPLDRLFYSNQLQANARATDRAIMNAGINPGQRMAGLVANGYNTTNSLGNLYRQAEEYNLAQREKVADFNRRTNMFNSQMGLEAAMANARYRQQAQQFGLSGLGQAAALRDSIDARIGAARSANITNLLNNLGNIGRENFALNQLNWDRSRNYWEDKSGVSGYKRKKSAACGGKINRNK